ncbi:GMC family oxidoreductase [Kribbella sp. NPDC050470]|uniref:GMC family oxidoreductase n=1 Tax=unclassified Kribbella TaxID=2644121 RepID=UPI0037A02DF4
MSGDVIVVGGGTAGCVLAARLTEDAGCAVLLIESGPDYPNLDGLPADVADASEPTVGHDWGYFAEADSLDRRVPLPRARLIGGCSATNGCFALRGAPADYDRWRALGNPGWSFAEVLPFFRRLESDLDFADRWHGNGGPIPIRRHPADELTPIQQAFINAAVQVGHSYVADHNRPGALGIGPTPRNVRDGLRMSSAITYLAAARHWPNLTIRADTTIGRVEIAHGRVVGVRTTTGELLEADRVVLAAGTYGSPAILARSGVGSAARLSRLGIDVVADLPAVGEHLIDHPIVAVDLPTRPAAGPKFQAIATLSSTSSGAPDLHLFAAGPFPVEREICESGAIFGIVAGLMAPQSEGSVRVRSADPSDPPRIDVAHLRHPDDLARMVDATVEARRIARSEPLAALVTGAEIEPGPAVADDARTAIAESIRARVASYHHPVGTCRMGTDPDRDAVVDARGRVYGVDRLWIADASVMPTIPTANTNLPTVMLAERLAAWLTNPTPA